MKILILGYPRAGTTLLYNMLYTTVSGYHFEKYERSGLAPGWRQNEIRKFPLDILNYVKIKTAYPDILFLLCIRDPRDLLCSKHWHFPKLYKLSWDSAIHSRQKDGSKKMMDMGLLHFYESIKKTGLLYDSEVIRFETLVYCPRYYQYRLSRYFNYYANFEDFHLRSLPDGMVNQLNGVRALDRSRIGAWKKDMKRIQEQFSKCPKLFDILIDYKYAKDKKWLNQK